MSESNARLHLVGVVLGVLAGFLLGYLLRPAPPPAAGPLGDTAAQPREPGLEGLGLKGDAAGGRQASDADRPPGATGARLVDEMEELIDGDLEIWDDGISFVEPEALRSPEQNRGVRGALARATLAALEGKVDECVQELIAAAASGGSQAELLDVCTLFEGGAWIQVVESLRTGVTAVDWTWDTVELADHALTQGAKGWGWDLLIAEFGRSTSPSDSLVYALLRNDARRVAPMLTATLRRDPTSISSETCAFIAGQLHEGASAREAAAFIATMLEAYPFEDEPLRTLALLDPVAAEAHALKRLQERPDDLTALRTLAEIYRERGDRARAVDAYRRLAQIQSDASSLKEVIQVDPRAGLGLALDAAAGSEDDEMIGALALAYANTGDVRKAFETYARAIRIDPEDYEWLKPLVELDPHGAMEVLSEPALRDDAGDELVGAYGNALLDSGHGAAAYEQYERALKMDPGDSEWQFGLARADPGRAVAVLDALYQEETTCPYRRGALGAALIGAGRHDEGLRHMQESVSMTADYRTVTELVLADETAGRQVLQRLLRNDPRNDEWHGIQGDLAVRGGRHDEALAHYRRAQELDPADDYWPRRIALIHSRR